MIGAVFSEMAKAMIVTAPRTALLAVLAGLSAGAGARAAEQDSVGPEPSATAAANATEEVIVQGQSRAKLRFEIQRAEQAVMDRFNELNSKDEYDVHCRREMLTGSNIPRRVCRADFWRDAQAKAGRETAIALQGGAAFSPQYFQAEALYKHELMSDEMRALVAKDRRLRNAVTHLGELQLEAQGDRARAAARRETSARVVTAADEPLPYDAAVQADVLIEGRPWSHDLTEQVFTIANVYGEIDEIDLRCARHSGRLEYEPGAEWNLPPAWAPCTLQVDGSPGTSFSLYEFE